MTNKSLQILKAQTGAWKSQNTGGGSHCFRASPHQHAKRIFFSQLVDSAASAQSSIVHVCASRYCTPKPTLCTSFTDIERRKCKLSVDNDGFRCGDGFRYKSRIREASIQNRPKCAPKAIVSMQYEDLSESKSVALVVTVCNGI